MRNKLQNIAKILRRRPTEAEKFMWRYLKSRQLEGLKFRRQEPIGNYVVDFVCYEKKIIVEIDGGQHCVERDGNRDRWLESQNFKILRFWNTEVLKNSQGVWEVIRKNCLSCDPPSPAPPIKGGEIYEHDHRKA